MGQERQGDIAARLVGGTRPVKPLTLAWDNPDDLWPGVVTEFWASTNLVDWAWRTNVVGQPGTNNPANRATFPKDKPAEFFKIRNCDTNSGLCSDWARK